MLTLKHAVEQITVKFLTVHYFREGVRAANFQREAPRVSPHNMLERNKVVSAYVDYASILFFYPVPGQTP